MRTQELFGYIKEARRAIALKLWRESFEWEEKARLSSDPGVRFLLHDQGMHVLHEAQAIYEDAYKMVIPEFSEN